MNQRQNVVAARPTTAKPRRWVRRRVIVLAGLQLRTLTPILLLALLQVLLIALVVLYPLHRSATLDPNVVVRTVLGDQLVNFQLRLWPALGLAAILAGIYTLTRSNRVAGPLYKLKAALMRMVEGQFQEIRFRRRDELRDFEEVVNKLGRKMDTLSSQNQRKGAALEKRIRWLIAHVQFHNPSSEEVARELEKLIAEFGHIEVEPPKQS